MKMHSAWRSLCSALAARSPVVAVIEDIHWADPALLDLLEELAERVVGPVLFVCPARPELTERRPGWGGGRRNVSSISLEPLTADQSDRLIGFLLSIDDLPASVHGRILERAEGNPFFLEEIVRHLIDEGSIVQDAGGGAPRRISATSRSRTPCRRSSRRGSTSWTQREARAPAGGGRGACSGPNPSGGS